MKNFVLFVLALMFVACSSQPEPVKEIEETHASKFEERVHPIALIDLGPTPCDGCGYSIAPDPAAVKNDFGLDGRIVIRKFDSSIRKLTVITYAGGPVLRDPEAPDPKVQKTYLPEKPQTMPQGENCVFWFSPFLQLTLRWDVSDGGHVVLNGHWYRMTYARESD